MQKIFVKNLFFFLIFLMLFSGCQKNELTANSVNGYQAYETSFFAMDTVIRITAYAQDEGLAVSLLQQAEQEFNRVSDLCNAHTENMLRPEASDVWRVNNAGGEPCKVSEELFTLLENALLLSAAAENSFDAAMGSLINLWDIKNGGYLPTSEEISSLLASCGNEKIVLNREALTVQLKESAQLDLGGIAKGYATDCAAAVLREGGIEHALIDAGGNIFAIGAKPDGNPWQVGIRNPENPESVVGVLALSNCAAVTSAVDQRYFVADGVRYHHILDPETGYPADSCLSLTVLCDNSTEADLLSTALFVLGEEGIAEVMVDIPPVDIVIIENDSEIIATKGAEQILTLLEE
ncbi:MAG: FAD:protein FMN transferase [Firmicutes bacterium]|nr:FAD:protein FMN transferase [Bacillota bacterium]